MDLKADLRSNSRAIGRESNQVSAKMDVLDGGAYPKPRLFGLVWEIGAFLLQCPREDTFTGFRQLVAQFYVF